MRRYFYIFLLIVISGVITVEGAPRKKKPSAKKSAKTSQPVPVATPRTSGSFVVRTDAPESPDGLQDNIIALWQSHGRYWDANEERWMWQRSRLLGTVEDLFPQAFVVPYLIPMLENAGAYVLTPRERDINDVEIIVDGDGGSGYSERNAHNKWSTLSGSKGYAPSKGVVSGVENPFSRGSVRTVSSVTDSSKASRAIWSADIPKAGEYAVYVSYASLPESAPDARYTVNSLRGEEEFVVNQTMGGGTWVYLGTFPFAAGKTSVVELVNISAADKKIITADAVRIGGGIGTVGRGEHKMTSGYPRWCEGSRYWLQTAGFPSSVYSVSGGANDYEDDLKSRALWVNYIAGGSRSLPGEDGLGIPVDLSFAFHTDAGTTSDRFSTIGTLPIVYTSGKPLGNGASRATSRLLAEIVADQVTGDIRALHDSQWSRRKLRDKAYNEVAEPRVPAMLMELMSHQNFADMRLGLDPQFRFDVSRAVYKGILRYLHQVKETPYTVTPLPVKEFAISGKSGVYTLSWQPTPDPLEPSALPTYYIVYERVDDGAFIEYAVTDYPRIEVRPGDSRIYSYKVVAANRGGVSFPSEVLALCDYPNGNEQVTVVNGFTRISGPSEVWGVGQAGFDYADDFGVPYIRDIHFTGMQTNFSTTSEWINNDAPGHGASRATHETMTIAGNTFDFVYNHGRAIRASGYGFVSSSLDAFIRSGAQTKVVDLILGKQKEINNYEGSGTRFKPFPGELKQTLRDFCSRGGALMVSGSYFCQDLFDNMQGGNDTDFGRCILGITKRQEKATVTGEVKGVKGRFPQFKSGLQFRFNQTLSPDCYAVESPESFAAADSSVGAPILRYAENDYVAATASALPTHKVVAIGFPFETIISKESQSELMRGILSFLTSK